MKKYQLAQRKDPGCQERQIFASYPKQQEPYGNGQQAGIPETPPQSARRCIVAVQGSFHVRNVILLCVFTIQQNPEVSSADFPVLQKPRTGPSSTVITSNTAKALTSSPRRDTLGLFYACQSH